MKLTVAVYNMEWMRRLFTTGGDPKTTGEEGERSTRLANVVSTINPDILGVVEGPDTTVSGSKLASKQLEAWAAHHGLSASYKGVHGFPSAGQQELCALFKSNKVTLKHKPEKSASKHPFNEVFLVDTTDSLVKEQYKHYRPPLELSVLKAGTTNEVARIIVAHTKSKGIFDMVDMARFEQLSERNRRKLYAECTSIRERCDQWLEDDPKRPVIVMGDINDGAGMDYYERRHMRSAVEILLGDVWEPELILQHVLPRPKLQRYGWVPSSSRFKDRITEDLFNVLIDHMLVSESVGVTDAMVWNPYLKQKDAETTAQVKALKDDLLEAADHFPVSAVLDL
jgi:endonuclease/exonuclease/phosphatase family metal-dependent hydrolase